MGTPSDAFEPLDAQSRMEVSHTTRQGDQANTAPLAY